MSTTADRHRVTPIALRLPACLNAWFRDLAERRGESLNGIITDILRKHAVANGYVPKPTPGRGPTATPGDNPA